LHPDRATQIFQFIEAREQVEYLMYAETARWGYLVENFWYAKSFVDYLFCIGYWLGWLGFWIRSVFVSSFGLGVDVVEYRFSLVLIQLGIKTLQISLWHCGAMSVQECTIPSLTCTTCASISILRTVC
jgi:hypothetical protein